MAQHAAARGDAAAAAARAGDGAAAPVGAGAAFSVDWFAPQEHVWRQHVVPRFACRHGLRMLEIGCWEGRSATWLLQNLGDGTSSSMVCIDPFEQVHAHFLRNRLAFESNLRAAGLWDRVRHMHMPSCLALPRLIVDATDAAAAASQPLQQGSTVDCEQLQQFDIVYIDGSHMRVDVLTDAVLAWQLLKVGGVLVFDDYWWDQYRDNLVCHPQQAVDAFLEVFAHELTVLSKGYQVMLERRAP